VWWRVSEFVVKKARASLSHLTKSHSFSLIRFRIVILFLEQKQELKGRFGTWRLEDRDLIEEPPLLLSFLSL